MRSIVLIAIFVLLACGDSEEMPSPPEALQAMHAIGFGSTAADSAQAVAVDSRRNAIVAGVFRETLIAGEIQLTAGADDDSDHYLLAFDETGEAKWGVALGGEAMETSVPTLALDRSDNIYLCSEFVGSLAVGEQTLSAAEPTTFVAKLSPDGDVLWARTYSSNALPGSTAAIATRGSETVYLAASISGAQNLGGQDLDTRGEFDIVLAELDAGSGEIVWVRSFGGDQDDLVGDLVVGGDALYLAGGTRSSSLALGGDTLSATDGNDGFAARLSLTGEPQWARAVGGQHHDMLSSLAPGPGGGVYAAGWFRDTIDIGGMSVSSSAPGNSDTYALLLSATGEFLWHRRLPGEGHDFDIVAASDPWGRLYIATRASPSDDPEALPLTIDGTGDGLVVRFSDDGSPAWYTSFGGPEPEGFPSLAPSPDGAMVLAGWYGSPRLTIGELQVENTGELDSILVWLSPEQ